MGRGEKGEEWEEAKREIVKTRKFHSLFSKKQKDDESPLTNLISGGSPAQRTSSDVHGQIELEEKRAESLEETAMQTVVRQSRKSQRHTHE